jgi:aminoglycoside phosphotransferase (APT) family kinase protein
MPAAEIEIDPIRVAALLADQWDDWRDQGVIPYAFGWDNFLFRIGEDHVARFPRRGLAVPLVVNEARWLPGLAGHLPLPIPAPVLLGEPGHHYPWPWTVVPWIEGVSAAVVEQVDFEICARQLVEFLGALHVPAPADAPSNPFRGVPLEVRDQTTRGRILDLFDDPAPAIELWEASIEAAPHAGAPLWIHADLHPHNLLVSNTVLSGVIDFGDLCGGDPATDLATVWSFLPVELHADFRETYGGDDDVWARAEGWALSLGLAYVANSADNPLMAEIGSRMLGSLGLSLRSLD